MAENSREIVLDILLTLEREEQFANKLIKAVLDKYDYLSGQEKAFIKRVAEGTIERQLELDYYLDTFSTVPVRKMKPLIRCLMRMSVYQILYMDAVPDSAVCNEACKLAGKRKFVNLKGFVNGVLRKIAGQKEQLPLPDKKTQSELYLSIKYSTPLWLTQRWLSQYGYEITEKLLEGLLAVQPVTLRFSTALDEQELSKAVQ
ncbi:MAG: 16S rRNA (cytosine(967)-C(5))-methyltransferase, partial [Lachnospiraceae bacterium]|nr:16S rRNA (cytosine(967)-C(5))-methyltransferase [Lachnospiraceae bacterium]